MAKPDMVGMVVADMGRALDFYRVLGLDIPAGVEGAPHVEVHSNGYRIAWDSLAMMQGIYPDWQVPTQGQRMSLAFKCDSAAEVDQLYQQVLAKGYNGYKEPWDAFWGQRYAVVIDPDGNLVDLFAPL